MSWSIQRVIKRQSHSFPHRFITNLQMKSLSTRLLFAVVAAVASLFDVAFAVEQGLRGSISQSSQQTQHHQAINEELVWTTVDEVCVGADAEVKTCDLPRGVEGFVVCRTRVSPRTQEEVATFSKCVPTERAHPTDLCGCCEGDEDCPQ